ncbi:MAG: amino acid adenylation domain-containing protein, partial [Verrucomicrobiota bacterium]
PAPQTPLTPLPSEPVKPTAKEETPPKPAGTPSGTSTNISRDFDESLSETQRQHLADLIARYTTKTKSSKEWTARYRKHYADPRTVSGFNRNWKEMIYQIVVEKSKGSRLLDLDGNEYVDILNGFGPGFFGHSPDFVLEAVKTQMDKGFEVGPQMMLAGETAEMFCELTGNERASFVCTGSEAVQGAMRIARTVTGRDKIAVFNKDYHGNFDEVLLRGGKSKGQPRTFPSAPGVPKQSVGNMLILDYGTDESLEILKAHAHELAAIMVEPVQSRWPEIQPCQFIHDLRKICDDSGSLFIMDEVICGLRDGPHGAQGFYKVKADLSTYGKVIGGGMPIGIVAGKAEYMDIFDGGQWQYGDDSFPETGVTFFAGTFVRHPLAIASAHAVLKHIKAQGPDLWKNLNARAERLYNTVNQFMVDNNVPVRVPGLHSRFFIRVNPEWKYGNLLFFHLREKGVFALEGFPSYLTTAHTDADIDYVINAFKESVLELQKGGFLEKTEALETLNGVRHQGPPPFLSALNPKPIASSPVPAKPQPEPSKPDLTPAPAPQRTTNLPLTEAQREIWLACQLGDDASCAFNEATSLSFKGNLDRAALSKALRSAVNHHDALRACFEEDGEQWEALHKVNIDIPFEDISKLPEAERFEALNRETALQAKTPFQLHQAPLVRAKLFQTENNSYVLFLTAHHIVADGWSFNVLIENLSDCYNAFVANTSPELEPSISFANYAIDRNKQEQSGEQSPHLSYWLGQFPDTVPMLNLPTDRPFPSHRTFEGSTVRQSIDGDLLKKLRRVGAKQGATLYATTLTAFEILLHRLTHQTDLVIGIPAAGQSSQGLDNMVGHCVNFLPLRTKVQPEQSFAEIVPQVAARVLEAYEHQDCTYGQLLPLLKLPRHPGRMPLVEIGFNLERMDYFKPFSGLETRFMDNPKSFVNQLLFFNLIESKDGLTLECHFNTHVLDPSTTQKWVAEYMQLLADIADKPNEPFTGPKETLTAAPGEPLPLSANNTTDYPRHATVQQLFEEIAAAHPGRPALQMRDWSMSYGQLNQHSNAVAAKLRGSGLAAGDPIPVLLDRSFDYIIAVLAVLKAGGAYVPIDPNYPQERIASLLYDLDFKHILTRSTFPERLPEEHRPGAIFVDQTVNCEEGERVNVPNLAPISNATDCAYMMFTSGSTGAAKGVQIPHRGIVRLVRNTNYATLDENETYLLASALSFDASTFEIWAPLLNGGKLVLLPPGPPSIDGIADAITHHGVTTMWLTSGLFQLMVEENLEALKPLRQLLAGGDVLSTYHVNKALHGLPNTRLINGYGPTENTTFTCCHTITTDYLNRSSIPIGRPISNTEVYLLDENQQPLPPEAEGELYLGGDGLALGYHNNPQLTDEKFVPNPFSAEPDSKLYRSGDRARYRADGTIEFIGRIDNEVKIRGFRIDPSEIETTLCNHVDVSQARVLAHGLTAADKSLVAYVATNNTSLSESELKSFIGTSLPDHLIPSLIIVLDKLPVTENGKIDDRALPAPGEKVTPLEGEIEYPQTETEHKMAAIWKAVLNLDVVPRNRSFFDLGGHSLQALKLFNRIHKEFGQKLPLSTLFEASTVEKLAARFAPVIEKEPSAQTPPFLVGLRKTGTKLPLFCIHGGDGGTLIYHNLSQGLTEDRPIYTLEAPALSGSGEVPETIEDTAAIYLKHIRTIQPEGPYLISGYCFGGIVAYEIAQQLRIRGEDIELLCLFDTDNPVEAPQYLTLAQRAATNWKSNEDLPVTKKLGKLGSRFGQGIVNKFKSKTEKAAAKVVTKSGFLEPDPTLQPVILREAHDKLMQAYQTKSFLGDLVLFTAEDQGDGVVYPPHLGWEGYIKGNLDLITIPGGHLTIFEQPHVQTLTTKLQEVLANRK